MSQYAIHVVYAKPMTHGQERQSYNADSLDQAMLIAHREYGKPLVKLVTISVMLERWSKVSIK